MGKQCGTGMGREWAIPEGGSRVKVWSWAAWAQGRNPPTALSEDHGPEYTHGKGRTMSTLLLNKNQKAAREFGEPVRQSWAHPLLGSQALGHLQGQEKGRTPPNSGLLGSRHTAEVKGLGKL